MTKNEFIQHMEAPHYVNEEDIVGLQEVLKEFPYCQSAQLLLTKAFYVSENLNFESQLKKTAAFAGNRKQLHALLFDSGLPELEVENNSLLVDNTFEEELIEGSERVSEQDENISESSADDFLEKQILVSAINSSILAEVSAVIPEDFSKKKEIEEPETKAINEVVVHVPTPNTSFNENQAHSFSDWLNFYGDDDIEAKGSEKLLWNRTSEEAKVAIESYSNSLTVPEKKEFYSASKMAKLSVQEDDDLVTETLANIYADQGSFEKAIKAFEKLQLKYPEKRVYFAGRIKEIQNSLKLL